MRRISLLVLLCLALPAVVRRLGRAEPRGRRRARRGHRRLLARAGHHLARPEGSRPEELEQEQVQGDGHPLGRRLRPPRRQPEAHPGLERPDQARRPGRHAEPVHVRSRPLERDGRLRRAARRRKDAEAGGHVSAEAVQARRRTAVEPPQSRGVGFVFQHYAAFKHMTVWDNIAFGLTIRRRPRGEIRARVAELLELVQLTGLAKRYPAQLSGGQRQRMGLARALAVDPKVLLLDEPFGALDARVRKELRGWLRRLHDETHTTTVIVTHDQEEAMDVADRVVVMNRGRIEQTAPPRDLYDHPANEFVMSFVGPVNRLGDAFIRPHDVELLLEPNGVTQEAMVQRLVHLGFEVRVELVRDDGEVMSAQLTREQVEALELERGQIVYVRPTRQTVFAA